MIHAVSNRPCTDDDNLLRLDDTEIWTKSHLARLRSAVDDWYTTRDPVSVTIDLSRVRHVPSGFFGFLCDLRDDGVRVNLYKTHERVQNLIWFQRFFREGGCNTHQFRQKPRYMA